MTTSTQRLVPLLLILATFVFEMSTDIYIPCLPEMTRHFGVEDSVLQMTLSSYLLGYALLGCLSGPLSDSLGRRAIFLSGAAIFLIGSLGCWFSFSVLFLIISRFIQGTGVGICVVITNAIIKDSFDEKNCSRILSTIWMIIAISPMIAPIYGAAIGAAYGWHANFTLVATCASIVAIVMTACLPETLPPEQRSVFQSKEIIKTYLILLTRLRIIGYALISALVFGGLWTWLTVAPFYIINELGIKSTDYGYYSAIGPFAFIIGTIFNQRLVGRLGVDVMLRWGLLTTIIGAFLLVMVALIFPYSIFMIYGALAIYGAGMAPVFSSAVTKALDVPPHQRGAAAALLNTIELAMASLSAFVVSLFSNTTLLPATLIMLGCIVGCCGILYRIQGRLVTSEQKAG